MILLYVIITSVLNWYLEERHDNSFVDKNEDEKTHV